MLAAEAARLLAAQARSHLGRYAGHQRLIRQAGMTQPQRTERAGDMLIVGVVRLAASHGEVTCCVQHVITGLVTAIRPHDTAAILTNVCSPLPSPGSMCAMPL